MDRFTPGEEKFFSSRRTALAWHFLGVVLVASYASTFVIWGWIVALVGQESAGYLPYLALAVILLSLLAVLRRAVVFNRRIIILAAAVAIVALFLADPAFPAKRIHVAQYLILALVMCRALSHEFPLGHLPCIVAAVLSALYGIHDEFLQGFHPERTFGLRDIGIDTLGAISGALVASAFVPPGKKPFRGSTPFPDRPGTIAIVAVIAGAGFLVLPLDGYRDHFIPAWSALPLVAGGLCAALLVPGNVARSLSFRIFAFSAFSLLLYPLASHVPTLRFY